MFICGHTQQPQQMAYHFSRKGAEASAASTHVRMYIKASFGAAQVGARLFPGTWPRKLCYKATLDTPVKTTCAAS
jgi:hypothetical protein